MQACKPVVNLGLAPRTPKSRRRRRNPQDAGNGKGWKTTDGLRRERSLTQKHDELGLSSFHKILDTYFAPDASISLFLPDLFPDFCAPTTTRVDLGQRRIAEEVDRLPTTRPVASRDGRCTPLPVWSDLAPPSTLYSTTRATGDPDMCDRQDGWGFSGGRTVTKGAKGKSDPKHIALRQLAVDLSPGLARLGRHYSETGIH
jgi:hypothetical protein